MPYRGLYGNGWFAARTGAADAVQVEMPDEIVQLRADYETNVLTSPTQEAQIEAMKAILQAAAEQFWVIGISRPSTGYQPFHARVRNSPTNGSSAGSKVCRRSCIRNSGI
jgi:hypothetical protein